MRTRVKICGITRVADAAAAARAGADAVGLVFDPDSPRVVDLDRAAEIARSLPPFVTLVGLFVNAPQARVEEVLGRVNINLLQFHGDESPEQCRRYPRPYVKVVHMRDRVDLHEAARRYHDALALLLDSFVAGVAGGSGRVFDWARLPPDLAKPLILAGGLTPENVGEAIRRVRPYAVDVSSGVERSHGVKDAGRISAFIDAVRGVS